MAEITLDIPPASCMMRSMAAELDSLSREDRLQLMRFLCSFAWADLRVQGAERSFVKSMIERLSLTEEEIAQVHEWLEVPPAAEDLDPESVPSANRRLFVDAARAIVMADGEVEQTEAENIALLEELLL